MSTRACELPWPDQLEELEHSLSLFKVPRDDDLTTCTGGVKRADQRRLLRQATLPDLWWRGELWPAQIDLLRLTPPREREETARFKVSCEREAKRWSVRGKAAAGAKAATRPPASPIANGDAPRLALSNGARRDASAALTTLGAR